MYSLNIDNTQYNNYNTVKSVRVANVTNPIVAKSAPAFKANHPQMTQVPYNSALTSAKFRTELVSNDEKNKYNELVGMVDKSTRKQLNIMLKNGTLLNADSMINQQHWIIYIKLLKTKERKV